MGVRVNGYEGEQMLFHIYPSTHLPPTPFILCLDGNSPQAWTKTQALAVPQVLQTGRAKVHLTLAFKLV